MVTITIGRRTISTATLIASPESLSASKTTFAASTATAISAADLPRGLLGHLFGHLNSYVMTRFPGHLSARLPGHLLGNLFGHLLTVLMGHLLAFLSGHLDGHLMTILLRHIGTGLLVNLLGDLFAGLSWDGPAHGLLGSTIAWFVRVRVIISWSPTAPTRLVAYSFGACEALLFIDSISGRRTLLDVLGLTFRFVRGVVNRVAFVRVRETALLLISGLILCLISGGALILISGWTFWLVDGLINGHVCGFIVSCTMDTRTAAATTLVEQGFIERRPWEENKPKNQRF